MDIAQTDQHSRHQGLYVLLLSDISLNCNGVSAALENTGNL